MDSKSKLDQFPRPCKLEMSIVELPRFHPMSEELEIDEAINVPITVQRQKLDDSLKKVAYYGYHMQKQLVTHFSP